MVASIKQGKAQMKNTENKFEYNGLIYIAVEESSCRLCYFNNENKCSAPDVPTVPSCSSFGENTYKSVCFVLSDIDNKGKNQWINSTHKILATSLSSQWKRWSSCATDASRTGRKCRKRLVKNIGLCGKWKMRSTSVWDCEWRTKNSPHLEGFKTRSKQMKNNRMKQGEQHELN